MVSGPIHVVGKLGGLPWLERLQDDPVSHDFFKHRFSRGLPRAWLHWGWVIFSDVCGGQQPRGTWQRPSAVIIRRTAWWKGELTGLQRPVDTVQCREYFFFNDTATTEIYTLSLHDALPI